MAPGLTSAVTLPATQAGFSGALPGCAQDLPSQWLPGKGGGRLARPTAEGACAGVFCRAGPEAAPPGRVSATAVGAEQCLWPRAHQGRVTRLSFVVSASLAGIAGKAPGCPGTSGEQ